MNCIVKARARLDLKKHWRYIARDNVDAADRLLAAAEQTFDFIAAHPELGSQCSFAKSSDSAPERLTALVTISSSTNRAATAS